MALSNQVKHCYRAYFIGLNVHIFDRLDFDCPDDDEAKEYAKSLVDGHDVELWYSDRKIEFFKRSEV
jgi:hypothetical protein